MLLIHAAADPRSRYSHYLAEILRLEGFADFGEVDLSALDEALLGEHELLILPRVALSLSQMNLLVDYVQQGGHLLALLPDSHLVARLGLRPRYRGIDDGYLHVDPSQALHGIAHAPIQNIVPSVSWSVEDSSSAAVLAWVHESAQSSESGESPAIVWAQVGKGSALLFAYDLPHAVARLRQGNPDHIDLCFAGLDGIYRPSELFVGQLPVAQMYLPQADIHTALLARAVEVLAPRPRLWYYPHAEQRSAMIMTSDDDWSTLDQFDRLLAGLRSRQAGCTFYVVPKTKLDPSLMAQWETEGHTFSVHPALESDTVRGMPVQEPQRRLVRPMLEENITRHMTQFGRTPRTIRQHAVRWLGYVDAARELAALGIRMDLNYVAVSPFLGHMCGSGRPLRFVDTDGSVIDCYQQPTHWTEECLIHPEFVFSFKWSVEKALEETGNLIQQAARTYYTPIALNSHPVSFATYSSPLIEGNWDTARAEGMPILSADAWLTWTEQRDRVRLNREAGGWSLHTPEAIDALTLLLPKELPLSTNGSEASAQRLWERDYTSITVANLSAGENRRLTTND
jgi:hypothetical protein